MFIGFIWFSLVFDESRSGAGICWDWTHYDFPRLEIVNYVEDRDIWKFALEGTNEVNSVLSVVPRTFEEWDRISDQLETFPETILEQGSMLMAARQRTIDAQVRLARVIKIDGMEVPVAPSPRYVGSDVAVKLLENYPTAPFAAYYIDKVDARYFGLRSTDERTDVSEVAERFGGGGHRNASGMTVPYSEKLDISSSV